MVRAGDFSKAHFGPTPLPPDLAKDLMEFQHQHLMDGLEAGKTNLLLATKLLIENQAHPEGEKLVQAVFLLDQIHSLVHGVAVVCDVWTYKKLTPQGIEYAVNFELTFARMLLEFGKEELLNRDAAHRAIKKSSRANIVNSLAWTDDLGDPSDKSS